MGEANETAADGRLKAFLKRWMIQTLAVLMAVYLVKGIEFERPVDLAVASLLLGICYAFLRPILMLLSLPLLILTLGLFTFVINGAVLFVVGRLLEPHFRVASYSAAFRGALVISVISTVLNILTGTRSAGGGSQFKVRWQVNRGRRPARPTAGDHGNDRPRVDGGNGRPPDGPGPVIDV